MPAAECCNTFAKKKTCFFLQLRLKYYILTAEIKQAFIRFSFHICKAILFIKKSAHIRIPCCGACCLRMRAGTPPALFMQKRLSSYRNGYAADISVTWRNWPLHHSGNILHEFFFPFLIFSLLQTVHILHGILLLNESRCSFVSDFILRENRSDFSGQSYVVQW